MSKVFEMIMQKQINAYIEKFVSPYLCGLRKGFGTQDALTSLIEKWKSSLDQNVLQFFARIYFREWAMLRIFVNANFHESAILRYFASTYVCELTVFSFSRILIFANQTSSNFSRGLNFANLTKIN